MHLLHLDTRPTHSRLTGVEAAGGGYYHTTPLRFFDYNPVTRAQAGVEERKTEAWSWLDALG